MESKLEGAGKGVRRKQIMKYERIGTKIRKNYNIDKKEL